MNEHEQDAEVGIEEPAAVEPNVSEPVRETPGETERRLRRDVARYREQARTAQSEKDNAIVAMREQSDNRLIGAELRFQAARAGIIDLDVLRLIDPGTLRLGDDGTVEGAHEAIDALRQSKPYLFGAPGMTGHSMMARTGHPQRPPVPAAPEPVDARTLSRDQWQVERSRLLGRAR